MIEVPAVSKLLEDTAGTSITGCVCYFMEDTVIDFPKLCVTAVIMTAVT